MKHLLRRHGRSTVYLMITDWLIIVGTFSVALHLRRYDTNMNIISRSHIAGEVLTVFLYAAMLISIFSALNLYKRKTILSWTGQLLRIFQGVVICILGYLLLRTSTKALVFVPSRLVILNWAVMQFSALVIHRQIIFPILFKVAARAQMQRRIVIIGVSEASITLAQRLMAQQKFAAFELIGFLSNKQPVGSMVFDNIPCLGLIADLPELTGSHDIEGAIITQTDLSYQELMDLIERCIRLFGWVDVHTDKSSVWHNNLNTDTYFDIPFVRMGAIQNGALIRAYKVITDMAGAAIGIILLSPILIATAVAIKLTSPGPVFYTRKRVGKDGNLFPFYKFRSMSVGADRDSDRAARIAEHITCGEQKSSKIVNEAYVTPIGRFIRKWAIDELPQLFNVLKGDMSLVGPRPVPPDEYAINDGWHKKRFEIKPGCTGLWKVYTSKDGTSFNETVLYDLYYARNMSLFLDIYILMATVFIILKGRADG